ncbi:MAG: spore gernimation protein [Paenibacillus sp.]|nr:spore gernimation protein [Paenibacillus sp.]
MATSKGVDSMKEKKPFSSDLNENTKIIEHLFANCVDLVIQPYGYGKEQQSRALVLYFETLVQDQSINFLKSALQDLVTHEVGPAAAVTPQDVIKFFSRHGVSEHSTHQIELFNQLEQHLLMGNVVVLFDEWDRALSYSAMSIKTRPVGESTNEPVVIGPHESTVENMQTNLGLLRTRLRSAKFKVVKRSAGGEARTEFAYCYLDGSVDPETLTEFISRLEDVQNREIMETTFIEEFIEDSTYSPFPQFRFTERPDTAIASVLDGKIIVLTEGSPSIMICPGLFTEFFSSSEDYYERTVYASLIRVIRIIAFFMALTLPSIYIALTTFHPELIPTVLLLAILDTREGIPFPAFVEAIIMEFFFEVLREAGVRLPRPVGSAVSIVGALVIGQAAIQAKIASPIMVIVVALTGIASFSIPQYHLAIALRILRFPFMILAATLGGFGLMIGFLLTLLHLTTLRSLGQPYLAPLTPLRIKQLRDTFIRAPLKMLLRTPRNRHQHKTPRN